MATTYYGPASESQISYITALLHDRDVTPSERLAAEERIATGTLDKATASKMIDTYLSLPKVASKPVVRTAPASLAEGMYSKDGLIYRVHTSMSTGNRYAKRLDLLAAGYEFVYAPGAIKFLTNDDRMSLEEAQAWGVETGHCCVCGIFLTNPKSVAKGIGPVCAKNV